MLMTRLSQPTHATVRADAQTVLCRGYLLARLPYRARGRRRGLRARTRQFRAKRAAFAGISGDQSEGARSGDAHRSRHSDGNPGDARLHRAELPPSGPGASRRSFRFRRTAGFQFFPLLDPARCARASHARPPLGRRPGGNCRDEAQSAGLGRRLIRSHRAAHVPRALGRRRGLHDLRPLSLHHRAMDGGRRHRPRAFPARGRPPPHAANPALAMSESGVTSATKNNASPAVPGPSWPASAGHPSSACSVPCR